MQTLRGLLLIFEGKPPEAVDALRLAIEKDPQSILARSALGNREWPVWRLAIGHGHS